MNNDQISAIVCAIESIELNLNQPLNLDEISREVGLSKYHFHRLFKSIAGLPLMSYVRARRLSLSLSDLVNTDFNIIDIAVTYQFEHEQSYIKAFQNQFHITPAKYRKLRCEMPIEQKIDISSLHSIGQGFVIQPRMCIKPQFYIQGIKKEIFHQENLTEFTTNKLAEEFYEFYLPHISNKINENFYLALIQYSSERLISNDYIPCVETSSLNTVESPSVSHSIPSQEYAVFRYVGFHAPTQVTYSTLFELYDYILGYWKNTTTYKQSKPYHIERMDLSMNSKSYCELDIYIPICL